ncbi:MAG: hypothetical protein GY702_13655 [Desulfobulbaceae bacterium]|nr:hypothetical protein [Desulfobulbaceae bacterium]
MTYRFPTVAAMTLALLLATIALSQATSLQGKVFRCNNSSLPSNAKFSFLGRFISETEIEAELLLNLPTRAICNFGQTSISAVRNTQTGIWTGSNVSFKISADGYVNDFKYSKSSGSTGTCKISMTNLKISGPALPFLNILMK